jgi:hypothetical protein
MMPAIWLRAYRRVPVSSKIAPRPIKSRNSTKLSGGSSISVGQIGIWMISLIRDGRFLRSPRSVIDV